MSDNQTTTNPTPFPVRGAIALICLSVGIFGGPTAYCIDHEMLGPVTLMAGFVALNGFLLFRSFGR